MSRPIRSEFEALNAMTVSARARAENAQDWRDLIANRDCRRVARRQQEQQDFLNRLHQNRQTQRFPA